MELTLTHHMVDNVEPQDEVMDSFRRMFRLVAGCEVSKDGMRMTYQLKTLSGAVNWLSNANSIITANKLPLKAGVKQVKKGEVVESVTLIIQYKPH
jgi:hypothetical protein